MGGHIIVLAVGTETNEVFCWDGRLGKLCGIFFSIICFCVCFLGLWVTWDIFMLICLFRKNWTCFTANGSLWVVNECWWTVLEMKGDDLCWRVEWRGLLRHRNRKMGGAYPIFKTTFRVSKIMLPVFQPFFQLSCLNMDIYLNPRPVRRCWTQKTANPVLHGLQRTKKTWLSVTLAGPTFRHWALRQVPWTWWSCVSWAMKKPWLFAGISGYYPVMLGL